MWPWNWKRKAAQENRWRIEEKRREENRYGLEYRYLTWRAAAQAMMNDAIQNFLSFTTFFKSTILIPIQFQFQWLLELRFLLPAIATPLFLNSSLWTIPGHPDSPIIYFSSTVSSYTSMIFFLHLHNLKSTQFVFWNYEI